MFYIKKILPLLFRGLDAVLAVSESTKKDLLTYGGIKMERIVLTPNAVDAGQFCRPSKERCQNVLQKKFGIVKPFILYVSRVEHPGKNHWKLIEAYRFLKEEYNIIEDLVFAGPLKERADEPVNFAKSGSCAENIHFTDYLSDEELCCFYAGARIMVFPSFFEGFGLPLLEAMAFGLPVACSNTSSLPEVAADAALYFNPADHRDMGDKILRLLKDENLQNKLRERGYQRVAAFSWRDGAVKIMDAIEKICA
jgi:glycosyltransferase involved in cell wall biosynthesis